jgi:hypothetical protein
MPDHCLVVEVDSYEGLVEEMNSAPAEARYSQKCRDDVLAKAKELLKTGRTWLLLRPGIVTSGRWFHLQSSESASA